MKHGSGGGNGWGEVFPIELRILRRKDIRSRNCQDTQGRTEEQSGVLHRKELSAPVTRPEGQAWALQALPASFLTLTASPTPMVPPLLVQPLVWAASCGDS